MFGVTPAAVAASVVSGVCVGAFNAVTTGGVVAAGGTLRDWKGGRSGPRRNGDDEDDCCDGERVRRSSNRGFHGGKCKYASRIYVRGLINLTSVI